MINIGENSNLVVLGYGVSGKSIHRFLKEKGHNVSVFDDKAHNIPDEIKDIDWETVDIIVKSPSIPCIENNCHPIIKKARMLNIPVLSTFDIFMLYNPTAKIVSITGTNGKSTTTALTYHILKKAGISTAMGGNIGIPYCDLPKASVYIFEMSSYELASSKYLDFEIAANLNIQPDHLTFHENFDNYVNAKHASLENAKTRIVSYEDFVTMSKYKYSENTITISTRGNDLADIYVYEGALIDSGQAVIDLSCLTELRGKHNHQNAAFAYEICKNLALPPKEIANNMMSFKALPHRLNIIRKIKNVLFVNDSKATNPDSAAKALDTYVGYKIFWLVGGRSKKTDPLKSVEPYLDSVQKMYLFGEATEEFQEVFKNLKSSIACQTMEKALREAYNDASNETGPSVILLSPMCASFDQFESYEQRGNDFVKFVMELN